MCQKTGIKTTLTHQKTIALEKTQEPENLDADKRIEKQDAGTETGQKRTDSHLAAEQRDHRRSSARTLTLSFTGCGLRVLSVSSVIKWKHNILFSLGDCDI